MWECCQFPIGYWQLELDTGNTGNIERDPEQREVARRHVEGVAEDVVDAARDCRVPRAEAVERNVCSRAICGLSHAIGKVSKDEHAIG